MALADTAKLIVDLSLRGNLSQDLRGAGQQLNRLDDGLGRARTGARQLGFAGTAAATAVGHLASQAIAAGVRGLASAFRGGVESLYELESVTTATNTVLASTKGVSGQTAQGIRDLAEEYESLNATIDDKVIQSGANLLLTFTNIRDDAFEPALEAALNLNEAMGGGEEGLQGVILQVGKALNDPIRGVSALRRAGVQLSAQQEDQIKTLVEQNDLYGAQQILLDELTTQFGGQFANAGQTATGRMAALSDTIEDLQKAFAGPLIPVIDRLREGLIRIGQSDAAVRVAENLGQAIAGLFSEQNVDRGVGLIEGALEDLAEADFGETLAGAGDALGTIAGVVSALPWQSIADAARLLGTGSKALLDAFLGLPPWVQTAVLTAWGLNKLSGGFIGQIASGLIKGILGINAGVVNINAGVVNGGGGGLPGGGGRGGGGLAGRIAGGAALAGGIGLAAVAGVMTVEFVGNTRAMAEDLNAKVDALPRSTGAEIDESIERLKGAQEAANATLVSTLVSNASGLNGRLDAEMAELQQQKAILDRQASSSERGAIAARDAVPWAQRNASEAATQSGLLRGAAQSDSTMIAAAQRSAAANETVAKKRFDPLIRVDNRITIPVSVNASVIQQRIVQQQSTSRGTGGDATSGGI